MHELIRRGLWIALALSAVLHPAAARADRVGLLPLRVQGGDPGEEVRLALRAAIGETLTAGGAEVHWPEAIEAAREAGRIPCA
ncbi:MAG TPA: hypothetical protein RMH99_02670, partial [Sandaracinaceae bacterium LLY-WYZ-13_1]|nr:hypothetical protein [Sandaracinaceae bacterium LLY-WYZ-13_1]